MHNFTLPNSRQRRSSRLQPKPPRNSPPNSPGRPPTNFADQAKVLLMAQYFVLPNRAAQGYILLFREKLHLKTAFSYKTIERSYSNPEVREILDEVFELTQLPIRDLEKEFGPDATGLTSYIKQNFENDRQKNQTQQGYDKVLVRGV